jgi:hypothetical protein
MGRNKLEKERIYKTQPPKLSAVTPKENKEHNAWKVFQAHINCPRSSDKLVSVE